MWLPFFRKSEFRRIYWTERNVRCTVTKIPMAKTWFAYFPVLMQTFLLDSLNSVQKNALIRRNDPFFFSFGSSFLFSQLTPFLRFFAKFGSTIWGCFFKCYKPWTSWIAYSTCFEFFESIFNFLPSSKIQRIYLQL